MIGLIFNLPNFLVIVGGGFTWYWCNKKYKNTKSHALLNCIPGVFTSLGLLGTFWSICYSLHGLGGVQPELIDNTGKTLAEVQAAGSRNIDIMNIISELIPAFTSSILGLLGALVTTIWAKNIFAEEEKLESKELNNISPEEYIRDIAINTKEMTSNKSYLDRNNELLVSLIDLHKEEREKNREYNDKLNENISRQSEILKEFIEGFVKRMDEIFKQMHGSIQQQVLNFGEEQFSKTSQLLTSITERLSNVSSDIINNQRQSVETVLNNTNSEISNITTSVTDVLGNLTKELQNSLSSLHSQQAERLNTIITNYDSLATVLSMQNSDFATKMTEQMQSEYSKVQEHNVQSLQQMVDLRTAYQEATSEVLTSTISMNEKATADLRESMNALATKLNEQMNNEYAKVQEHNTQSLQQMIDMRNAYQEATSNALNSTLSMNEKATADLRESMNALATKLNEQMNNEYAKVQEHNTQSLQQMIDMRNAYQEATSNALNSTLSMNEKATADLRESIGGLVTDIQGSISAQCTALSTAIATNVESLNKAYEFVKSLVAEIRQNYDQAVLAYGDAVNVAHRTNESAEKAIAANNKSLQAVEETNAKISEILNLLDKRQENIEQLTKHISSISGSIVELQKLESTLNKIVNK